MNRRWRAFAGAAKPSNAGIHRRATTLRGSRGAPSAALRGRIYARRTHSYAARTYRPASPAASRAEADNRGMRPSLTIVARHGREPLRCLETLDWYAPESGV